MADLPAHISRSKPFESPFLDCDISSPPSLPIYPTLHSIKESPRRTPSPPAPTIYLTGYRCHASDPEYRYAREKTGEIQPYWFDEAHGAADFNEGVRRRAKNNMAPHEDEVAIIDLDDDRKEMDRVAPRDHRERARERARERVRGQGSATADRTGPRRAVRVGRSAASSMPGRPFRPCTTTASSRSAQWAAP